MSDARAIKATFSTWRPVNGRKVLQLVFEVPIEQQGEVLTMLGAPDDKWCAIALLNASVAQEQKSSAKSEDLGSTPSGSSKPKKRFEELSLVQQCAMRCDEPQFHAFLNTLYGSFTNVITDPATFVRSKLRIASRKELDTNAAAGYEWIQLERSYQNWLTDKKYADARR